MLESGANYLSRRRRAAFVAVIAAGALAASIALFGKLEADVPLFDADLHPAQAVEVQDALTLWGEPFHANAQNTQIYVPSPRRRDVLLRLTLAGLPHRFMPTSADVLDDQTNALTPLSVVDDRRRSGIEGDIVAGLRRIGGVADATVVLPPASDDGFEDDPSRAPSAGVQLVMQPGAELSADAVGGIKRFVAAAYPGLTADRVTVVDGSGSLLGNAPPPDRGATKERRIQIAVQSALDAVLGTGAAVVRVSVGTSEADAQTQSTRVVPHGEISAETGLERGSESGKTFDKERSIRRFAYDTTTERRSTPAGAPTRMSVAVFLDSRRVEARDGDAIASLVRAAAGADLQAGDVVVVQGLPFAAQPQISPRPVPQASGVIRGAIIPAVVAIALALFGLSSFSRPAMRVQVSDAVAPSAPELSPAVTEMLVKLQGESPQTAAFILSASPNDVKSDVLAACSRERRQAIERFMDGEDA